MLLCREYLYVWHHRTKKTHTSDHDGGWHQPQLLLLHQLCWSTAAWPAAAVAAAAAEETLAQSVQFPARLSCCELLLVTVAKTVLGLAAGIFTLGNVSPRLTGTASRLVGVHRAVGGDDAAAAEG